MSDTKSADKKTIRVISLTDRAPVKIVSADWPVVAEGSHESSHKSWENEREANQIWKGWLKVRQHRDGRAIVYGCDEYSTNAQGADGYSYRGGELLPAGADLAAAIGRLVAGLIDRGGSAAMLQVAHECIASLPAEAI
jgi:hypothetical protein